MQSDQRESKEYEDGFGMPKILVVGCGGAGNNTVSRLARMGLAGAKTVAINQIIVKSGKIEKWNIALTGDRNELISNGRGSFPSDVQLNQQFSLHAGILELISPYVERGDGIVSGNIFTAFPRLSLISYVSPVSKPCSM